MAHSCPTRRSSDLVRLGDHGKALARPAHRQLAGEAADALDALAGEHGNIDAGLQRQAQVRAPADAGVLALRVLAHDDPVDLAARSEEHTSELQSLMRISYAVFCLKKKKKTEQHKQQ